MLRDLRSTRRMMGLTMDQIAKRLKVRIATVSLWENRACQPQPKHIQNISRVYGWPADRVVRWFQGEDQQQDGGQIAA
jgi:transcriptional regulator with XRE-family HTH domain